MTKMRAVIFKKHGNTNQLEYTYFEKPTPGPDEVLIRVRACALNHLDIWTLMGTTGVKIPLPHILGCDIAGEVAAVGSNVKGILKNKRVIVSPGIPGDVTKIPADRYWDSLSDQYQIIGFQVKGGYAEYVNVPKENIIPVSKKYAFESWAAVPLVYLTAWHMLVTRAKIKKGETVLIHAAGSGVGSAGIQIAKYLGACVITTVGSEAKVKKAKNIGADHVINYRKKDFAAEVHRITKKKGVDVVMEHIGPATFSGSLASLKKRGRLVTCGVTSGPDIKLNLRFVFARQLSIIGCYMGGLKELKKVVELIEKKKLKPIVDKVYPLRQAEDALNRMLSRQNFGKIVLINT